MRRCLPFIVNLPYSGNVLWEKTFANWWKNGISLLWIARLHCLLAFKQSRRKFTDRHKTAEFAKVFFLESFPLYGTSYHLRCSHLLLVTTSPSERSWLLRRETPKRDCPLSSPRQGLRDQWRGRKTVMESTQVSEELWLLWQPLFCYVIIITIIPVVQSPSPSLPLYLQALMPSPEDGQDGLASEDDQKSMEQEGPLVEQADSQVGDSPAESMELSEGATQSETFENPFLKPPKRIKLKIL